jgi:hypothetical protein
MGCRELRGWERKSSVLWPKLFGMKRTAALLAFILLAAGTARAQWTIENSGTTADLRGIFNVGGGVAWASGTNGTVLRTEDGGYLWQSCAIPPNAEHLDFRGIQAFDANMAIVMSSGKGDLSRLYQTTDGCHTWKLIFTNPVKDGFWDALILTPSIHGNAFSGVLIGDTIPDGLPFRYFFLRKRSPVFPIYHTRDGGATWTRQHDGIFLSQASKSGKARESIFAASNSSMVLVPYGLLFVTGGKASALHYMQYFVDSPLYTGPLPVPLECGGYCVYPGEASLKLASGKTAGGFSLAANYYILSDNPPIGSRVVMAVGGDFKMTDATDGTAVTCRPELQEAFVRYDCDPAQTPPHGYRSAVAYEPDTKAWITVGPNGTDISTDDGKNWRALHPDSASHEASDADKNWNALSLPFVVGPHGRVGKLNPHALVSH